ncbi:MFS transporter [Ktedonobacter racemifer]|uniref:Major facilitator superfamily (MFS) profile domain-containing protein n=1 Tax=Ktedonobacter racemifer DSM 44963 TaxID=485913 RepID=D6TKC4_KTERA|nr:MFS transporter [Ktedonobacter racemifer]EFH86224.1 hypothetical protein Krac_7514 [Ktedonobacter racemifer DSM 44963]
MTTSFVTGVLHWRAWLVSCSSRRCAAVTPIKVDGRLLHIRQVDHLPLWYGGRFVWRYSLCKQRDDNVQAPDFLRELKEGIRFYRENHLMLTIFLSVLIATLGTGALDAILIFFFQRHTHASVSLFGTLPMAIGAGSIVGALLAGLLVRYLGSVRVYWLSLYITGIMFILFALQNTLCPALIFLFLVGLPLGALNTALGPLLMYIIPRHLMGRVESVFSTSQTLFSLTSISLSGLLATLFISFHANLLTFIFDIYDTIYIMASLLFILGALYAMLNLRGLKIIESN